MNRLIIIILMFLAFLGIAVYRPNAINKPVISDWEEIFRFPILLSFSLTIGKSKDCIIK